MSPAVACFFVGAQQFVLEVLRDLSMADSSGDADGLGCTPIDAADAEDACADEFAHGPAFYPAGCILSEPDVSSDGADCTYSDEVVEFRPFEGLAAATPVTVFLMDEYMKALFDEYDTVSGEDWNWACGFNIHFNQAEPRLPIRHSSVMEMPSRVPGTGPAHLFVMLRVVGPTSMGARVIDRTVWTFAHADLGQRVVTLNNFSLELIGLDEHFRRWCEQPGSLFAGTPRWDIHCRNVPGRFARNPPETARCAVATMQYYLEHRLRVGHLVTSELPAYVRGYTPR